VVVTFTFSTQAYSAVRLVIASIMFVKNNRVFGDGATYALWGEFTDSIPFPDVQFMSYMIYNVYGTQQFHQQRNLGTDFYMEFGEGSLISYSDGVDFFNQVATCYIKTEELNINVFVADVGNGVIAAKLA